MFWQYSKIILLNTSFLFFIENYGNLHHKCCIFISNMPHTGFIYEASMAMKETYDTGETILKKKNLSLLTFSGEVRLPGGGEAGAGEDEEESVNPPGCGGHGSYHAACTNQLSTKLNNCMRPIMLSIANIITLSVSVQCPCPLYIFIFYACPFPLSYHILLPIPSFIECDVNYVPESQPSSSSSCPLWLSWLPGPGSTPPGQLCWCWC